MRGEGSGSPAKNALIAGESCSVFRYFSNRNKISLSNAYGKITGDQRVSTSKKPLWPIRNPQVAPTMAESLTGHGQHARFFEVPYAICCTVNFDLLIGCGPSSVAYRSRKIFIQNGAASWEGTKVDAERLCRPVGRSRLNAGGARGVAEGADFGIGRGRRRQRPANCAIHLTPGFCHAILKLHST